MQRDDELDLSMSRCQVMADTDIVIGSYANTALVEMKLACKVALSFVWAMTGMRWACWHWCGFGR